ncbi:MAG TPA: DEAD/DEAH box helicase, partial [Myxococcota bacterium]|nr:DEAD/DEAH box helicase [Myxococcota bacterium]
MGEALARVRVALREARAAVLVAPPGAGKTTLVPLALLDEPWLAPRGIVMLEPRRLAARAAAARMAAILGEAVGETVGYRIRFEARVSARTRIEVVTEGILGRRLQDDPGLEGAGLVVFDEFHERHLDSDLSLALCVDARRVLREDLRVLVMSATLDGAAVARALGGVPVVTAEGRSHPVEVRWEEREPEGRLPEIAASGVRRALRASAEGDVLAFLPGAGEIRRARALLGGAGPGGGAAGRDVAVHALFGELPAEEQDRALRPDAGGRRKVVLATSIAETSLTIEGVR